MLHLGPDSDDEQVQGFQLHARRERRHDPMLTGAGRAADTPANPRRSRRSSSRPTSQCSESPDIRYHPTSAAFAASAPFLAFMTSPARFRLSSRPVRRQEIRDPRINSTAMRPRHLLRRAVISGSNPMTRGFQSDIRLYDLDRIEFCAVRKHPVVRVHERTIRFVPKPPDLQRSRRLPDYGGSQTLTRAQLQFHASVNLPTRSVISRCRRLPSHQP